MAQKAEPVGATLEARFLIAALCRLVKSLSHSEQMGWLVGAVGIEPGRPQNFQQSATDKPQSILAMLRSPNQLHSSMANCRRLPPRQFGMHLFINNIHY
jgi:hypothetical protein